MTRAVVAWLASVTCATAGFAQSLDWPMVLQNPSQTARSPLRGTMQQPPRVAWSYGLGLSRPQAMIDQTQPPPVLLDLNSDGKPETIQCDYGATSFRVVNGASGEQLWSATTEQPIYEQLFAVADVNADGRSD